MEFIKQNFSIKDLEHMSGIKAHTIRIWEKRYHILHPDRSGTNIRTYDIENLQKILNVAFLKNSGYKISVISEMPEQEMKKLVKEVSASTSIQNRAVNAMKVAMLNFDKPMFIKTYEHLLKVRSFREIFYEVFLPLLSEIGILWQTDTINPVHEHFISGLIKEKICQNIALLQKGNDQEKDLYVLFLPQQEIHDLGLLFINYELNFHNRNTIFLGPSIPMENMRFLLEVHPNPRFVSYLTVTPTDVPEFINQFEREFCSSDKNFELNLLGAQIQDLDPTVYDPHIKIFKSIPEFVSSLN